MLGERRERGRRRNRDQLGDQRALQQLDEASPALPPDELLLDEPPPLLEPDELLATARELLLPALLPPDLLVADFAIADLLGKF